MDELNQTCPTKDTMSQDGKKYRASNKPLLHDRDTISNLQTNSKETRPPETHKGSKSNTGTEESAASKKYKIGITCLLLFKGIAQGISIGLIGVTMLDLRDRLGCDTTMKDMGTASGMAHLGGIVGTFVGGFIYDRFHYHGNLIMGVSLLMSGIFTLMRPWASYVWSLAVVFFITGIFDYAIDTVTFPMLPALWGPDSNMAVHFSFLGFPLGQILGPLIAAPFLSHQSPCEIQNSTNITTSTSLYPLADNSWNIDIDQIHVDDLDPEYVSKVEIPYVISGLLLAISGLFFGGLQFATKPKGLTMHIKKLENIKDICSPARCGQGSALFAVVMIICMWIFYFLFMSRGSVLSFLVSIAVEGPLQLCKNEAAMMESVSFILYLIGRFIATGVAHWSPIQPMLFVESICFAIIATLLAVLGNTAVVYMWVFTCLFQFFSSPLWPGGLAWGTQYIYVTAFLSAIVGTGVGAGGFLFRWLAGYVYTNVGPEYVFYVSMVACILLLSVLTLMQVIATCHYKHKENYKLDEVIKEISLHDSNSTLVITKITTL